MIEREFKIKCALNPRHVWQCLAMLYNVTSPKPWYLTLWTPSTEQASRPLNTNRCFLKHTSKTSLFHVPKQLLQCFYWPYKVYCYYRIMADKDFYHFPPTLPSYWYIFGLYFVRTFILKKNFWVADLIFIKIKWILAWDKDSISNYLNYPKHISVICTKYFCVKWYSQHWIL